MAVMCGYYNSVGGDRKYNAEQMSAYFKGLLSRGVVNSYGSTLQVSAAEGMTVQVGAGKAFFSDGRFIELTSPVEVALEMAPTLQKRIDRIVLRTDTSAAVRAASVQVLTGEPSLTPAAPALTSSEYIEEICLAEVLVEPNVSQITNSKITDTRADEELCGFCFTYGQIIAIGDIAQQYDAQFHEWFDPIKDLIGTSMPVTFGSGTYTVQTEGETEIPLGLESFADGVDSLSVYINGLRAVRGVDYTLSEGTMTFAYGLSVGTVIEFAATMLHE